MKRKNSPRKTLGRELVILGAEFLALRVLSEFSRRSMVRKVFFRTGVVLGVGALGTWVVRCYQRSEKTLPSLWEELRTDFMRQEDRGEKVASILNDIYSRRHTQMTPLPTSVENQNVKKNGGDL